MDYFIGLDIGTSAVKGAALCETGEVLATAKEKFTYETVCHTGVILAADSFLSVCFSVINQLTEIIPQQDSILAVCASCASGNLLLLGKDGYPLTPFISWQSSVREEDFAAYYTPSEREWMYQTIGWPVVNGFPAVVFPWLLENRQDLLSKANMVCMSAEYLNYAMTGSWGISHSMATPFYLVNQVAGAYEEALLKRFSLTPSQLPPIFSKGTVLSTVKEGLESALKLPAGTPVVLESFDHPAGAVGAGVFDEGDMLLSCGTSWVALCPLKDREKALQMNLLVDRSCLDSVEYCAMRSLTSVSHTINTLIEQHLGSISDETFDALAAQSQTSASGLEIDFSSAGHVETAAYEKRHIARAILEGAARQWICKRAAFQQIPSQ